MAQAPIYKVIFHNNSKVYELYARAIYQSDMYGFIEIEEFVFGEQSQIVVNPGEEKLKNEFSGVTRSYIDVVLPRPVSHRSQIRPLRGQFPLSSVRLGQCEYCY